MSFLFAHRKLMIIALIVGVVMIFLIFFLRSQKTLAPVLSVESPSQKDLAQLVRDTDHDGLQDWEEALWKTDPHNADTDGDGTPDGEEVKEGRDPTSPGPNDKLPEPQLEKSTPPDNPSQAAGQELLSLMIGSKINQGTLDQQAIADRTVQQILSFATPVRDIKDEDITFPTTSHNDNETVKWYFRELSSSALKEFPPGSVTEAEILQNFLKTGDASKMDDLLVYAKKFKNIRQAFSQLRVPIAWKDYHRELIKLAYQFEVLDESLYEKKSSAIELTRLTQKAIQLQQTSLDLALRMQQQAKDEQLAQEDIRFPYFVFFQKRS